MILLLLGLAALFLGPMCAAWLTRFRQAQTVLDAFVVVAIGGLVLFHIIPESIEQVGWPAIAAVAVGLLLPMFFHGPEHDAHHDCHPSRTQPLVLLAGLAMGLHAFFDGVALAPMEHTGTALLQKPLAWAAILHRALEGTGIWWLLRPHWGRLGATWAMLALGAATVLGFWSMHWAVILGAESQMACLQACAAGSLLHVLLHHTDQTPGHVKVPQAWSRSFGTALGLLLLLALAYLDAGHHHSHGHADHVHEDGLAYWIQLGGRVAPWIVFGWIGMAVTHVLIPQIPLFGALPTKSHETSKVMLQRSVFGAVLGMLAETPLPNIAALYHHANEHTFSKKTMSVADLVFVLFSSSWGMNAWILAWICFGARLTLLCSLVLALGAMTVGILGWRLRQLQRTQSVIAEPKKVCVSAQPRLGRRFADGLDFALGEGINGLAPWLVWGIWLASMVHGWCDSQTLMYLADKGYDVWLLALVAYPVYLHPIASILTAFALWQKGITLGAAITFVLANAVTAFLGLESVLEFKPIYRRTLIVLWVGCLCPMVGYFVNCLGVEVPPGHLADMLTPLEWFAFGGVGIGVLGSCLRQGIRKFLEPITAWSLKLGHHQHHHDV